MHTRIQAQKKPQNEVPTLSEEFEQSGARTHCAVMHVETRGGKKVFAFGHTWQWLCGSGGGGSAGGTGAILRQIKQVESGGSAHGQSCVPAERRRALPTATVAAMGMKVEALRPARFPR